MKNLTNEKPQDQLYGRPKWIIESIDLEDFQDKDILNIGCGFGWFEYNMAPFVKSIIGVEPDEKGLQTAKRNINIENVDFQIGDALKLPFEDSVFDTVVSWEVIEHIPKNTEKLMINEISRVLKSGGVFYLSTPYKSFRSCVFDPAWLLTGHRHYSFKKMREIIENSGVMYIVKMLSRGGFISIMNVINLYISKWIFRRPPFLKDYFSNLENDEWKKNSGYATLYVKAVKK